MNSKEKTQFHPSHDRRIDTYINKSQAFAEPILRHLRALVHQACPEVKETIKWGMPHFMYKGEILCSMAGFKAHCVFLFWKGALMQDSVLRENAAGGTAMGLLGKITEMDDLPEDKQMLAYLYEAMELNEKGVKLPKNPSKSKMDLVVPEDLKLALEANTEALDTFENFSYSNQKEYIEWLDEAKTENTRNRRLKTAIAYMEEGKPRNWKYMKKWK
ncbi:YdeI/OmpD-associated family protein [Echinicola salinicaeni]|uniref:YdeI/OmpD-associated family protein n=1 Tax=Echinicola salinicaeni TaxID=2762757 RepID=UPI001646FC24|nr:YdeI/OmpD-associated family protein [Echinicola salinicaeni]